MDGRIIERLAPAKLNIGLRIVGRDARGYHLLESLFWPVALHDRVLLRAGGTGKRVTARWDDEAPVTGGSLPQNEENLVHRVLEAGGAAAFDVEILKRIPMGGGLGGGSSDAGTVAATFCHAPDAAALARFGADIPFFLHPVPAWVTGIGEHIARFPDAPALARDLCFLLVFPPVAIATPEIFAGYRAANVPFSPSIRPFAKGMTREALLTYINREARNDLEGVVAARHPEIGHLLDVLRSFRGVLYGGLSGTGSTCFAIFTDPEIARECAKVVLPGYRSGSCRSVLVYTHGGT